MAQQTLWTGLLLSAAVGLLCFAATARTIENESRERFANHARTTQNTISARVKSYTDVLRGTASLFQTNEAPVTRDQFRRYVAGLSLETQFPAIVTINFAQFVKDGERDDFERGVRAGRAQLSGPDPDFHIVPAGRRPEYLVMMYIEPNRATEGQYGQDLQARPYVSNALMMARDTGVMVSSGIPIVTLSGPKRTSLGMRLPIYRINLPLATVEERRAAYLGSVGIAFSVPILVQGVLDEIPVRNVRLVLVDSGLNRRAKGTAATDRLMFDSSAVNATAAPPALPTDNSDTFSVTLPIDYNDRLWKANFSVRKSELNTGINEYFPWLALLAGLVGSMLVYALLQSLTSSRRRAITIAKRMTRELRDSQAKLQLSHENLRRLAAHADHIKEGERKRIAREIHDDLGQNLLVLRMEADMLSSRTGGRHPRLHARAQATLSQIDATIKSVRQIINDLRPNVLDLGLSAAIEWQVGEFGRRTGIECELADDHQEDELDDRYATAFFRVLQESLSNIARHAQASAVKVELKLQAGRLSMTVSDNGVGLPAGGRNKTGSFGLVGIEERIHLLGGVCSILSFPGAGTAVYVSVPVHATTAAATVSAATPETGSAIA